MKKNRGLVFKCKAKKNHKNIHPALSLIMAFCRRLNIFLIVSLIAASCFLISLTDSLAATLEVGTGKPYSTIQSAITASIAGDTVLVYDGIYNEALTINKTITVKSQNGSVSTIIQGNRGGSPSQVAFGTGAGSSAELDGFTIKNGGNFKGGGISLLSCSPTIKNCIVTNCVSVYGGGIYCNSASPSIVNCIIAGNLCAYGGGIYCENTSKPKTTNCTFIQNRTDNSGTVTNAIGAGIYCKSSSVVTVVNSILWGNTANSLPNQIYITGGSVNVSYSDIEGGFTGSGNINNNPLFALLGTWTGSGDSAAFSGGNFHLQSESLCIDAGTAIGAPANDIDGDTRPQENGYDMGADEYVVTIVELSSLDARAASGRILITWSTESEIDNAGFNIYRAEVQDEEYIKINDELIPSAGEPTAGETYELVDEDVQNRKTYYYKLEDIDLNGTSTMHGPVSATPRLLYGLFQ